ncbi:MULTISPECIES: hypothetical protein [Photobacterium]|uniref:Uncharacterized protein n=1 Tax=Photobacterium ganghwense TaxID=320778 RepID=A0A0J1H8A0_9GAMM|nr:MULTISPECIES: hypothetical protein [Photobacterium]KLV07906.1 hypothetical protein ABT57_13670 [Photobacterium ganghwense]MBV1842830.1 hypothetical protein [Photobacterium ganghwense]PSU07005.1 hypothetical protein C9I92_14665 [Photobacterium ganghwense]QSV15759.1 hypothetical protein FH974_21080 [Photobacterium ganghwense]
MDTVDFDGIKRDISDKVSSIFENFEESNSRLPTMEEFRALFDSQAEQYIGPLDKLTVEQGGAKYERFLEREQKLWRAVNELEAEQRCLRSDS